MIIKVFSTTPPGGLKGSEDAKVQCREGAMVGVNKCRRFKGSEDAKVQCWEGAMVGGHKCGRFERSEDVKIQCSEV